AADRSGRSCLRHRDGRPSVVPGRTLRREDGFGLIEMITVVLIIGILIAVALITFLGGRQRAENRVAQTNLHNALVAATTYFSDGDTFAGFTATCVAPVNCGQTLEPSLDWTGGSPASE